VAYEGGPAVIVSKMVTVRTLVAVTISVTVTAAVGQMEMGEEPLKEGTGLADGMKAVTVLFKDGVGLADSTIERVAGAVALAD
jgi:hypothetical protein